MMPPVVEGPELVLLLVLAAPVAAPVAGAGATPPGMAGGGGGAAAGGADEEAAEDAPGRLGTAILPRIAWAALYSYCSIPVSDSRFCEGLPGTTVPGGKVRLGMPLGTRRDWVAGADAAGVAGAANVAGNGGGEGGTAIGLGAAIGPAIPGVVGAIPIGNGGGVGANKSIAGVGADGAHDGAGPTTTTGGVAAAGAAAGDDAGPGPTGARCGPAAFFFESSSELELLELLSSFLWLPGVPGVRINGTVMGIGSTSGEERIARRFACSETPSDLLHGDPQTRWINSLSRCCPAARREMTLLVR